MNTISIYQVDAFTDKLFGGNPAAVCPLDEWLEGDLMQKIAAENNLAETAFFVKNNNQYEIRWFTPTVEVDLCGHATLASAHVLFEHLAYKGDKVTFHSHRSGVLEVVKEEDGLLMNFPVDDCEEVECPAEIVEAIKVEPLVAVKGKTDYLVEVDSEDTVRNLNPNIALLSLVSGRGIIVTARGNEVDFVSRFFAPQSGIDEDPVTGSAHTTLTPFWSSKLKKDKLSALQVSKRGGVLRCELSRDRVIISGKACTYLVGQINI